MSARLPSAQPWQRTLALGASSGDRQEGQEHSRSGRTTRHGACASSLQQGPLSSCWQQAGQQRAATEGPQGAEGRCLSSAWHAAPAFLPAWSEEASCRHGPEPCLPSLPCSSRNLLLSPCSVIAGQEGQQKRSLPGASAGPPEGYLMTNGASFAQRAPPASLLTESERSPLVPLAASCPVGSVQLQCRFAVERAGGGGAAGDAEQGAQEGWHAGQRCVLGGATTRGSGGRGGGRCRSVVDSRKHGERRLATHKHRGGSLLLYRTHNLTLFAA